MDDRFAKLRMSRLVVWPLVGILAVVVLHYAQPRPRGGPPLVQLAYVLYGLLLLAALRSCHAAGIRPSEIFGTSPRDPLQWRTAVLLVPLLLVFSAASVWATTYVVVWVAPEFGERLLNAGNAGPIPAFGKRSPFLLGINIALVAPIVEEFVFRGMLLRRWVAKSGFWAGVIGSALVFSLLHPQFWIGSLVHGIVLGVLYLATGSLLLPILTHALNNGLVFLVAVNADKLRDTGPPHTLAQFRAEWIGGVIVLVIATILVIIVVRRLARRALTPVLT